MRVTFQRLGEPSEPGWYDIAGIGMVQVNQEDIDEARELEGRAAWNLVDVAEWEHGDPDFGPAPAFQLGGIIPLTTPEMEEDEEVLTGDEDLIEDEDETDLPLEIEAIRFRPQD